MAKSIFQRRSTGVCVTLLSYEGDSTNLLDFENKKFERRSVTVKKQSRVCATYLVKHGSVYESIAGNEEFDRFLVEHEDAIVLAKVFWDHDKCFVESPDPSLNSAAASDSYSIISDRIVRRIYGRFSGICGTPIAIREGDRIRLGRAGLTVRYLAQKRLGSMSYLHDIATDGTASEVNHDIRESIQSLDDLWNDLDAKKVGKIPQKPSDVATAAGGLTARSTTAKDCDTDDGIQKMQEQEVTQKICRICLCGGTGSGPLVAPCKCKGSLNYVHLECIRTWIKGRLKFYDENGMPNTSFLLQKLQCELCGVPYPSYVDIDNKETGFLGIDQPEPPYAIFEPENTQENGYFLVSLAKKVAVIGRGHECDIRLTDISVSRLHSSLYFSGGNFILEDRQSKFGVMILKDLPFKFQISAGAPVCLKIGNDILCFSVKSDWGSLFSCCARSQCRSTRFII